MDLKTNQSRWPILLLLCCLLFLVAAAEGCTETGPDVLESAVIEPARLTGNSQIEGMPGSESTHRKFWRGAFSSPDLFQRGAILAGLVLLLAGLASGDAVDRLSTTTGNATNKSTVNAGFELPPVRRPDRGDDIWEGGFGLIVFGVAATIFLMAYGRHCFFRSCFSRRQTLRLSNDMRSPDFLEFGGDETPPPYEEGNPHETPPPYEDGNPHEPPPPYEDGNPHEPPPPYQAGNSPTYVEASHYPNSLHEVEGIDDQLSPSRRTFLLDRQSREDSPTLDVDSSELLIANELPLSYDFARYGALGTATRRQNADLSTTSLLPTEFRQQEQSSIDDELQEIETSFNDPNSEQDNNERYDENAATDETSRSLFPNTDALIASDVDVDNPTHGVCPLKKNGQSVSGLLSPSSSTSRITSMATGLVICAACLLPIVVLLLRKAKLSSKLGSRLRSQEASFLTKR